MRKELMNYEALLKFTRDISIARDPEQVVFPIVESVARVLEAKGCALFLFNPKADKLELAASYGLSDDYLNKGPISSIRSIALSLQNGPVAISDVAEDPRIQYPEEAKKEGICSILSVPIIMQRDPIGALRVYTATPWEATLEDVNFVQAMAQLAGMALEMCRLYKGLKDRIEILEMTRGPKPLDGQTP